MARIGASLNIDLASVLAVGGPTSVVGAIVAILLKSYLEARRDRREQQASDVQTDSGIVDNAKKVLDLVRNETDRMELKILEMAEENKGLRDQNRASDQRINELEDTVARQARDIEFLRDDLRRALQQVEELRAANGNS